MSTPTCIHHSGDVNTPAGSAPLTLPRRLPRVHASPAKDSAAGVLFAADEKHDEDDGAAKEKEINSNCLNLIQCCQAQHRSPRHRALTPRGRYDK
jgi:hypothetical protein